MIAYQPIPGVLNGRRVDDIGPYGCHTERGPERFVSDTVTSRQFGLSWPFAMSRTCQYDRRADDPRCRGCGQP